MAENSSRILNYQYAPGIATYGVDGARGKKGEPGTAFFFTSYDLSSSAERELFLQKVSDNRQLTSYWDAPSDRNYVSGDLILDVTANLYRINQINGKWQIPQRVAKLKHLMVNDFFGHDDMNRIYLRTADTSAGDSSDNTVKGLDIVVSDDPDAHGNYADGDNTLLRVISEKKDKSGDYNLMSLLTKTSSETKKYLNVTYNENTDTFSFKSNADVVLDCKSLSVDYVQGSAAKKGSDMYRIAPYDDNIGLIHYVFSQAYIKEIRNDVLTLAFPGNTGELTDYRLIVPDFIKLYKGTGTDVRESIYFPDTTVTDTSADADGVAWNTVKFKGMDTSALQEISEMYFSDESQDALLMQSYRIGLVKGVEVMLNYANKETEE